MTRPTKTTVQPSGIQQSVRADDEIAAIIAMGIMAVAMLCLLNGTLLNLTVASAPLTASGIPSVMEQR